VRSNPIEAEAAKAKGGIIANGYLYSGISRGGLQMSRALGDKHLASVLSRTPDLFTVPFDAKTGWILVASDGLFDPSHELQPHESNIIDLIDQGGSAVDLVEHAVKVPTYDNATAILARVEQE
jgi:serine/threonine protein phosphatase PrpC